MAFTLDQNVQGAAAYQQAIQPTSSTGLSLAGNFLEGLDTFARSQVRQDQAEAQAANAARGTQAERDRNLFGELLNSAKQDLNSGTNPDDVAAAYAARFAVLDLNDSEKSVLINTFGEDIYAVPIQPVSLQDTAVELYNAQSPQFRLGLMEIVLQQARTNGETITTEEATGRAVNLFSANAAQANAAMVAGNLDYASGFSGNMETLQRFGTIVSAMLSVETSGGNFNIEEMLATMASFEQMKAQPAFMEPSGGANAELWAQMQPQIAAIDRLFEVLQGYDDRVVSAKAAALTAEIILGLSKDNPIVALAATNPEIMNNIAAEFAADLAPDFSEAFSTNTQYLNNVVSFSDLEFDPAITNMLNIGPAGSDTPSVLLSPETVFPSQLQQAYTETVESQEEIISSLDALRPLMGAVARNPARSRSAASILDSPEATEVWMSAVTNMSYLLSQTSQPSAENLDALFSPENLTVLRRLEENEEYTEQAAILRQQMAQALRTSSNKYATVGLGQLQQVDGISVNPETLTVELNESEEAQEISVLVDRYYDGDFNKLLREGPLAWENLRRRLVSQENIPRITTFRDESTLRFGGQVDRYSPEYEAFLSATRAISPYHSEGALWKEIYQQQDLIRNVQNRLQDFRRFEESLRLDSGFQAIVDSAVDRDAVNAAVGEALGEPPVATSITTPQVTTTVLPPAETAAPTEATPTEAPLASMGVQGSGTEQDPITFTTETGMTDEMYQAVPAGAYYRDPTGLVSQKREGRGVTTGTPITEATLPPVGDTQVANNDSGDGGDEVITPNGIEEYNALPSGTRWRDPDGNIRTKP
jgi:hypothetical protein